MPAPLTSGLFYDVKSPKYFYNYTEDGIAIIENPNAKKVTRFTMHSSIAKGVRIDRILK
jgi:hypothetical protein